MRQIAKLFKNGNSQAVRLPMNFRFEGEAVFIRQDPETGDIILSRRPESWHDFCKLLNQHPAPDDFLSEREENTHAPERDIFEQ